MSNYQPEIRSTFELQALAEMYRGSLDYAVLTQIGDTVRRIHEQRAERIAQENNNAYIQSLKKVHK